MKVNIATLSNRKTKSIKPVKTNRQDEVLYRKQLLKKVYKLQGIVTLIIAKLKSLEGAYVKDVNALELMLDYIRLLRNGNKVSDKEAQQIFEDTADKIADSTTTRLARQFKNKTGVNVDFLFTDSQIAGVLSAATAENVALIRSIPDKFFDRIEAKVTDAVTRGVRAEQVAKDLQATYQITENRAKLIARDQAAKLNAAVTQERAKSVGINQYIWRTSGDERVREEHAALEGKTFSFDDPPDVGNPGEDYNCRCVAQLIF